MHLHVKTRSVPKLEKRHALRTRVIGVDLLGGEKESVAGAEFALPHHDASFDYVVEAIGGVAVLREQVPGRELDLDEAEAFGVRLPERNRELPSPT
jgi:hypothetical protein